MKKLNNKGYMLVEIIIASVLALIIAWFLIDVTVKMVNKNNDYYIESVLLTDKNVITKEIMDDVNASDLNLYSVTHNKINDDNHKIELKFKDKDNNVVTRIINISNTVISYIYVDNDENDIKYERTLNENLKIGDIEVINDPGLLRIDIPAYMNFSDENYGINLMVKYNGELEEANLPEYYKYEQIVNLEGTDKILSKDFNLDNNVTKIKSCEIVYSDGVSSVVSETVIEQSDYIKLVNDDAYPFNWNSINKMWSNTNFDFESISEMSFSAGSSGDYKLCYNHSFEEAEDYANFYVDNVLKGTTDEELTEECLNLGNLTTSSVIKVEYIHDSYSRRGNISFYLKKITSVENSGPIEKKAIVNCEPKGGKIANVKVDTNDEQAINKVEQSCDKDANKIEATPSQGSCSNYSCNYGDSRSGSTCYATTTSTRTIYGSYRAHYRCHYGEWVNVNTTDATHQPCEEYETQVGAVNCNDDTPPPSGTCSPDGITDSITATCTRKCRSSSTTTYSATCTSYNTVYSCDAIYTKIGTNCYRCNDSSFTFNKTTLKCDGTCLVDNYNYNIKIIYK